MLAPHPNCLLLQTFTNQELNYYNHNEMHQVEVISHPRLLKDSGSNVQNWGNYGDFVDKHSYQLDKVPQRDVGQKNFQIPLAHVKLPSNYAKFAAPAPRIPVPRIRPAYLDRKVKNSVRTAKRSNIENKVIKTVVSKLSDPC